MLSRDGTSVPALGPDILYHIYPLAGGEPRSVPGFTLEDELVRMSADGRSVLASRGAEIPPRVERIDLGSGRRVLVQEIAPADRAGLVGIGLSFVSGEGRSYARSAWWYRSTLFTVEWGREG